jgi:DNA-binding GntR family transcriptional regulator
VQVAAAIRERVRDGRWAPKLPTRQQIANDLDVSHMTVQRAIDLLKAEGLLYSVPGRGVYVAKPQRRGGGA